MSEIPDPHGYLVSDFSGAIYREFVQQALNNPNAPAIQWQSASCSYGELDLISSRVANYLLTRGIGKGNTVAIVASRSPALVYAVLGVTKSGATFYIADAEYPESRIRDCLCQIAAVAIVVTDDLELSPTVLVGAGGKRRFVLRISSDKVSALRALADCANEAPCLERTETDIAYVGFTSGSTGRPKGIFTSHAPLPHFVGWHVKQHQLTKQDRFSLLSGLSHDPILRDIFTPLSIGATVCVPMQSSLFEPKLLVQWLEQQRITVCHLTPSLGEIITSELNGGSRLPDLRWCFWGGEVLRPKLTRKMREIAPNVKQVNFYGATETPQAMGHFPIDPEENRDSFPVGVGIEDVQLLVVNAALSPANVGEVGEIWIRTKYLSRGYWDDDVQTAAKFVRNPFGSDEQDRCYRTGDEGRYLPDGNVEFVGRSDHQVKIRGFRVELGEVTKRIEGCPGVDKAIVLASEVAGRGRALVAYFTREGAAEVSISEVRDKLRRELPGYMVPSFFVNLERFPLLPNGKTDMLALAAIGNRCESPADEYAGSLSESERELARLWQELLGIPRVGRNDSFTDLGGDSITAIRALVRMRRLGISDDRARGIFQGKTIAEIALEQSSEGSQACVVAMPLNARTTLAVNVVRGILCLVLVAGHWCEGGLNRLPKNLRWIQGALAPLFNAATPGFAFVFGISLGYVYFSMYRSNPRRAVSSLTFGASLVGAAVLIDSCVSLLTQHMAGATIDSHVFFVSFFGPLTYYLLALLSVSWWFRFLLLFRNETVGCIVSIGIAFTLDQVVHWALLEREQWGFWQLCRLMLVAKYAYFNMSVGVLGGIGAGILIKQGNCRESTVLKLIVSGVVLAAIGSCMQYLQTGAWSGFSNGDDLRMWRWTFYPGCILVAMGAVLSILKQFESLSSLWLQAFRWVGVLGQCTLGIVALHGLVIPTKGVLKQLGVSEVAALVLPLVLFFTVIGLAARRIYTLYYGDNKRGVDSREPTPSDAAASLVPADSVPSPSFRP